MIELTKSSWTKMKKSKAKKLDVPSTGLGAALKSYEKTRKALVKAPDLDTLSAARTEFRELVGLIDETKTVLEGGDRDGENPFAPLLRALRDETKPSMITDEEEWFQELFDELEEQNLVARAASEEEAAYEKAMLAFQKLQRKDRTREWFPEAVAAVDGLDRLAERVTEAGVVHLIPKYQRQRKILARQRADLVEEADAYVAALRRCIAVRQALLVDMQACTRTLDGLKDRLEAQLDRDPSEADAIRVDVAQILQDAEAAYAPPSDAFAPGAPIRSSTDTREAGLHASDVAEHVQPHLTALIQANKPNNARIKEIRELASSIEAWLPAVEV